MVARIRLWMRRRRKCRGGFADVFGARGLVHERAPDGILAENGADAFAEKWLDLRGLREAADAIRRFGREYAPPIITKRVAVAAE